MIASTARTNATAAPSSAYGGAFTSYNATSRSIADCTRPSAPHPTCNPHPRRTPLAPNTTPPHNPTTNVGRSVTATTGIAAAPATVANSVNAYARRCRREVRR